MCELWGWENISQALPHGSSHSPEQPQPPWNTGSAGEGGADGEGAWYIKHGLGSSLLATALVFRENQSSGPSATAGTAAARRGQGGPTCFSEWEVVFGIVHPQDWVVVGAGDAALGWGALVQRAVLGLPARKEREGEGTSFTPVAHRGDERSACRLREQGTGHRQRLWLWLSPPGYSYKKPHSNPTYRKELTQF